MYQLANSETAAALNDQPRNIENIADPNASYADMV